MCCHLGSHPGNPLLLLGQYSDDELEKDKLSAGAVESSDCPNETGQLQNRTETHADVVCKMNKGCHASRTENMAEDIPSITNLSMAPVNNIGETSVNSMSDHGNPSDTEGVIHDLSASVIQVIGDLNVEWKLVMHEESNQYYYWNTVTGQTSWEEPNILTQETEVLEGDKPASPTKDIGKRDMHMSTTYLNEEPCGPSDASADGLGTSTAICEHAGDEAVLEMMDGMNGRKKHEILTEGSASGRDALDTIVAVNGQPTVTHVACIVPEAEVDTPSRLLKYGQRLLQKLKELEGFSDTCLRYIVEVEIRLSDCEVLSPYGSTLLPFWWHSEAQLRQLESTIHDLEASLSAKCMTCHPVERTMSSRGDDFLEVKPQVEDEKGDGHGAVDGTCALSRTLAHYGNGPGLNIEQHVNENTETNIAVLNEPSGCEDVDMDVDMEVDDLSSKHEKSEDLLKHEQFSPQAICPSPEAPSMEFTEEFNISPPPDNEWIPPPPPESEPTPPPPPDEPPTSSFFPLPVSTESHTSLLYADQYTLACTNSTYEYCAPAMADAMNTGYYVVAEGSHSIDPQPSLYCESLADIYPDVATNTMEPSPDYDLQNENASSCNANSLVSSHFWGEPGDICLQATYVDHVKPAYVESKPHLPEMIRSKSDRPTKTVNKEPENSTLVAVSVALALSEDAAAAFDNGSLSSAATASVSSMKNLPKATRIKKRAVAVVPSWKSNKKVSSLVDKWKAAKEELHGNEEDETDSVYEMLEKKRQREIEEWHAQQIASGEAIGNANFQPLGGDWCHAMHPSRMIHI